jgi:uncharacterized membrane-anchored protein YhcB (DUF1043 family)
LIWKGNYNEIFDIQIKDQQKIQNEIKIEQNSLTDFKKNMVNVNTEMDEVSHKFKQDNELYKYLDKSRNGNKDLQNVYKTES